MRSVEGGRRRAEGRKGRMRAKEAKKEGRGRRGERSLGKQGMGGRRQQSGCWAGRRNDSLPGPGLGCAGWAVTVFTSPLGALPGTHSDRREHPTFSNPLPCSKEKGERRRLLGSRTGPSPSRHGHAVCRRGQGRRADAGPAEGASWLGAGLGRALPRLTQPCSPSASSCVHTAPPSPSKIVTGCHFGEWARVEQLFLLGGPTPRWVSSDGSIAGLFRAIPGEHPVARERVTEAPNAGERANGTECEAGRGRRVSGTTAQLQSAPRPSGQLGQELSQYRQDAGEGPWPWFWSRNTWGPPGMERASPAPPWDPTL